MRFNIGVGVFFFIAIIILGYFTIIMSEDFFSPYEYYTITVVFPDIEGLGVNDKVKINGVLGGVVGEVELQENNVLVTMKMHKQFTLYENYKIKIKNQTALGGKYASIYPGCEYSEGNRYAVIKSRENLKGESTGDVLGILSELVAENRENVYETIDNLKQITHKITLLLNSGIDQLLVVVQFNAGLYFHEIYIRVFKVRLYLLCRQAVYRFSHNPDLYMVMPNNH